MDKKKQLEKQINVLLKTREQLQLFEEQTIRTAWDEENEESNF